MTNLIKVLEDKLESLKPLHACHDRLRACLIQMGEGAFLRRREDGALDFFGHPGTALKFAITGSEFEKAKKILDQVRRDNPESKFTLARLDNAVVAAYKETEEMIAKLRPIVEAQG